MDDEWDLIETNRRYWDRSTPRKMERGSYPLDAFRAGESTLFDHEREEVGPVAGRSLLHLQCNNGLETLSWTREGAEATGIDISGESLRYARDLAGEVGLDAGFVKCDVHDVGRVFDRRFDVVYTSRGVLEWLPDLGEWAEAIQEVLTDGGTFYLFEGHPLTHVLDGDLDPVRSYFDTDVHRHEESGFGADAPHYQTYHTTGDVVSALAGAGLRVQFLHEFPFHFWHRFEAMVEDDAGRPRLPDDPIPLSFSVRAVAE